MVEQLLALSRVDAAERPAQREPVEWQPIVEQAVSDLLPLAERRRIELACDWPAEGAPAFAAARRCRPADAAAAQPASTTPCAMRREGSAATLRFGAEGLRRRERRAAACPPRQLARLGERFYRPAGQAESGSGLGISIAQRIAALHGLRAALRRGRGADGSGVVA